MQDLTKTKFQSFLARTMGWTTKHKHGIHILTYHSISSDPDRLRHTPPELFEEHICFLQQSGYKSFRVCDIASSWPAILTKAPAVIITFDDGLYDNREVAYSILQKYDMTATFFVPTAYIKNERSPSHAVEMGVYAEMDMMSWQDLKELVAEGFEIGAHSHSHVKVGQQEEQKALLEVELPKKILEEKLRMPVCSFAYPKG